MKHLFLATHAGLKTQSFFLSPMVLCARTMQLVGYFTQRITRSIARVFFENDPLWIMSGRIYEADDLLVEIGTRMTDLSEMMRVCELEVAKDSQAYLRSSGHDQRSVLTYALLLEKLQLVHGILAQSKCAAQFLLKDMCSLLKVKFIKRNALKGEHSITASARSVLRGEPIAKEMFDLENRRVAEEYATRINRISELLQVACSFMRSVDAEKGICEPQAMGVFAEWDKTIERLSKLSA
jgi:hypothetical protein